MSFSISSMVRLIVLLAVGTALLAVGVARLDPPKPKRRTLSQVHHFNVNEYFLDVVNRTPHWLDGESGTISAFPLADGDVLEAASSSPWVDDQGHRQVVGRWSSRIKDGPMSVCKDFGLARYSFPDGEMLDQISTETVPVGPPCWYPGTNARVLYAAGDGQLYHFLFEDEPVTKGLGDASTHRDLKPWHVSWRCAVPGAGNVFISDLSWPEDPRMSGRLVATVRLQEVNAQGIRHYSRTQLWSLKLNHAGTQIVDANRLVLPDSNETAPDDFDERSPTISSLPDGRLMIAYLRQHVKDSGWQLRIAPVQIDPDRQIPKVSESEATVLAEPCQPSHPAFSPDGHWLNAIVGASVSEGKIARIDATRTKTSRLPTSNPKKGTTKNPSLARSR